MGWTLFSGQGELSSLAVVISGDNVRCGQFRSRYASRTSRHLSRIFCHNPFSLLETLLGRPSAGRTLRLGHSRSTTPPMTLDLTSRFCLENCNPEAKQSIRSRPSRVSSDERPPPKSPTWSINPPTGPKPPTGCPPLRGWGDYWSPRCRYVQANWVRRVRCRRTFHKQGRRAAPRRPDGSTTGPALDPGAPTDHRNGHKPTVRSASETATLLHDLSLAQTAAFGRRPARSLWFWPRSPPQPSSRLPTRADQ